MPTAHNSANFGDFGKTCLMPGDPLRAKYVADNFLENPVLVNNVRNIQGYTGTYKGVRVSVMASGMGMPSIGIYTYELFSIFGVENIIRVGSAGAMSEKLQLRDVVAAQAACTNSNYPAQFGMPGTFAPIGDFTMLTEAVRAGKELGVNVVVGNILSSDVFYTPQQNTMEWAKMGVLAVEMEAAALYSNAAFLGKRALALLSISDSLVTGAELNHEQRQTTFPNMMKVALEVAVAMEDK